MWKAETRTKQKQQLGNFWKIQEERENSQILKENVWRKCYKKEKLEKENLRN